MFRIIIAALALATLTIPASPSDGTFYQGFLINFGSGSCAVVERTPEGGEKKIAGPFATRDEARRAMQQIPDCQSRN